MDKTAIIIIVFNNADLLLRQVESIRSKCTDDFNIIVVDNSLDGKKTKALKYHAQQLGVDYVKTFSDDYSPSLSHSFACNFAYVSYQDEYRYMFFMDHDMFPVKEFSVEAMLEGKHIAGLHQQRKKGENIFEYFWGGMVMIDNSLINRELVNFAPCIIQDIGLDTGGSFHHMIKDMDKDHFKFFDEIYRQNSGFKKNKYNFYSMLGDQTFMHFIGGSNWMGMKNHEERINSLLNILTDYEEKPL